MVEYPFTHGGAPDPRTRAWLRRAHAAPAPARAARGARSHDAAPVRRWVRRIAAPDLDPAALRATQRPEQGAEDDLAVGHGPGIYLDGIVASRTRERPDVMDGDHAGQRGEGRGQ